MKFLYGLRKLFPVISLLDFPRSTYLSESVPHSASIDIVADDACGERCVHEPKNAVACAWCSTFFLGSQSVFLLGKTMESMFVMFFCQAPGGRKPRSARSFLHLPWTLYCVRCCAIPPKGGYCKNLVTGIRTVANPFWNASTRYMVSQMSVHTSLCTQPK